MNKLGIVCFCLCLFDMFCFFIMIFEITFFFFKVHMKRKRTKRTNKQNNRDSLLKYLCY